MMDPNEALRQIRMVTDNAEHIDWSNHFEVERLLSEMIDHMSALDGWLSKGGFLPAAWDLCGRSGT